jgi:hypothetical protein
MDFTCAIGMVCVVLSSPAKVISDGDVAVTVPVSSEPSRISTVACCPEACFAHDARKSKAPSVMPTKKARQTSFGVYARPLQALPLKTLPLEALNAR